ncbi:MAG: hypothetical protein CMN78_02635 [Spirochaetales bacterium]|nr:hypothetical protein [Spirochaetales bacterium]
MRGRVFISYSVEDRKTAFEVCRLLEMQGLLCWIAPRDVGAGMIYAERIVMAIKECGALVLIYSSASNRSSHVRNEVERGFSHDKPIVAFRIEDTEPVEAFEYFLGSSQWLDAWGEGIEKKIGDLAEALKGIVGAGEQRELPADSSEGKERSESQEDAKEKVDKLLQKITIAFGAGDWRIVQDLSREILELDPRNRAAERYLDLASSELQTDEEEEAPREESMPASFADNRYEVNEFLGEGARKKVYLVHDTVLDRDVAFALIKTEQLDEDAKRRVVREAQVMGKLGAHTHIVTVHDMGEHDGQQYVVMELMGGGDLADEILSAPANRIGLDRTVEIGKAICRGLAFAHSKGIVHRDLKPSNVWLSAEGVVKIGDFGLALRINRSRITKENMIVGTVTYLSPEQATGADVTVCSDLYSMGAMMYEMVTGRPPFLGDDDVAVIGQHINTTPVAPGWQNGKCPKPLEALIMRLLAKSPGERPASASDVLAALEAIDLAAAGEAGEKAEMQSLDAMAGGVFVGRKREIGRMKAALEESLSGHGRMVMLVGEPGIGKTRTAEELRTYAGLRNVQVLWGRCYEGRGAPVYWPWVQAIRTYVREREEKKLRSELGSGAGVMAELISDIRERLPDTPKPVALDDPESSRFRLFDAVTTFMKSVSKSQPIVIVLDDLHWADEPSLVLLEFVAHELSGSRILVAGTYRDVELRRTHPLQKTLGDLTRERLFEKVLLRGLTKEDVGRFIEIAAGISPPSKLVKSVFTHTEGNPLFVTEVVRLLVQGGELVAEKVSRRKSWSLEIPEGVREVIGRRLDHLSARCNEVLTTASVVGRDFTVDLLVKLVEDLTTDRLIEVLEEALSARVVEELADELGHYQFTHRLIQETLLEELTITRRVRLHGKIAEAIEELYGEEAERHAEELVVHFAEAETVLGTEKLVRYSLAAGEQALSRYAREAALGHFQRGLEAKRGLPMDAETAGLEFGAGKALSALTLARQSDARNHLYSAFEYFEANGNKEQVAAVARFFPVDALSSADSSSKIDAYLDRALSLVRPESPEAGNILLQIGRCHLQKRNYESADEALQRALKIAQDQKDRLMELRIMVSWTRLEGIQFHEKEIMAKSSRVFELAQIIDNPSAEFWAHFWVANVCRQQGKTAQADDYASELLQRVDRFKDQASVIWTLSFNRNQKILMGDWQAARELSDRLLEMPLDASSFGLHKNLIMRAYLEYETANLSDGDDFLSQYVETARLSSGTSSPSSPYDVLLSQYTEIASNSLIYESVDDEFSYHIPIIARITGVTRWLAMAKSAGRKVLSRVDIRDTLPAHSAPRGLGLIAVLAENSDSAAYYYDHLVSQFPHFSGTSMGHRRLLGLLAHTAGKTSEAITHFENSLAFCRTAGYRPELAWTCCDYADVLRHRDNQGDREKAKKLFDEGLAITRELGMKTLEGRKKERLEQLGVEEHK